MKRILTLLMFLAITTLSANAEVEKSNVLNSIQIDSLKDTYNITLNTRSKVDIKRTIQSNNNIILNLKNVKPATTINTVYKNAAEVDSIMVEPAGNGLNISIRANNISNAAITSETEEDTLEVQNSKSVLVPSTKSTKNKQKDNSNSIHLSAPMNAYMPVYHEDNNILDEEDEEKSSFGLGLGLLAKIKNILSQGNVSDIITTGLITLILFCGIKLFKKEEPETAIGLTQSLKDREMSLYKDIAMRNEFRGPMSLENSASTLLNQPESTPIATRSALHNNIKTNVNVNVNAGYGLKAYRDSLKNPYMSSDILSRPIENPAPMQPSIKSRTIPTINSRVQSLKQPVKTQQTTASNIDSMKFLQSMTQIYEKNGRPDLAKGLKAGMLKAKANV